MLTVEVDGSSMDKAIQAVKDGVASGNGTIRDFVQVSLGYWLMYRHLNIA